MKLDRVREVVERHGIVLVYPVPGKTSPPSLWSGLYPKRTMEWSWDADADPRVAEVWHLREALCRTGDVAYAKWFRGRATFFSMPVFHALLGTFAAAGDVFSGMPREATELLDLLRERSPYSTKELRAASDLRGKAYESLYQHAMKALWSRLLVVGVGEVADGAFPSLSMAATEVMFEDVWAARARVPHDAMRRLESALAVSPFRREVAKVTASLGPPPRTATR